MKSVKNVNGFAGGRQQQLRQMKHSATMAIPTASISRKRELSLRAIMKDFQKALTMKPSKGKDDNQQEKMLTVLKSYFEDQIKKIENKKTDAMPIKTQPRQHMPQRSLSPFHKNFKVVNIVKLSSAGRNPSAPMRKIISASPIRCLPVNSSLFPDYATKDLPPSNFNSQLKQIKKKLKSKKAWVEKTEEPQTQKHAKAPPFPASMVATSLPDISSGKRVTRPITPQYEQNKQVFYDHCDYKSESVDPISIKISNSNKPPISSVHNQPSVDAISRKKTTQDVQLVLEQELNHAARNKRAISPNVGYKVKNSLLPNQYSNEKAQMRSAKQASVTKSMSVPAMPIINQQRQNTPINLLNFDLMHQAREIEEITRIVSNNQAKTRGKQSMQRRITQNQRNLTVSASKQRFTNDAMDCMNIIERRHNLQQSSATKSPEQSRRKTAVSKSQKMQQMLREFSETKLQKLLDQTNKQLSDMREKAKQHNRLRVSRTLFTPAKNRDIIKRPKHSQQDAPIGLDQPLEVKSEAGNLIAAQILSSRSAADAEDPILKDSRIVDVQTTNDQEKERAAMFLQQHFRFKQHVQKKTREEERAVVFLQQHYRFKQHQQKSKVSPEPPQMSSQVDKQIQNVQIFDRTSSQQAVSHADHKSAKEPQSMRLHSAKSRFSKHSQFCQTSEIIKSKPDSQKDIGGDGLEDLLVIESHMNTELEQPSILKLFSFQVDSEQCTTQPANQLTDVLLHKELKKIEVRLAVDSPNKIDIPLKKQDLDVNTLRAQLSKQIPDIILLNAIGYLELVSKKDKAIRLEKAATNSMTYRSVVEVHDVQSLKSRPQSGFTKKSVRIMGVSFEEVQSPCVDEISSMNTQELTPKAPSERMTARTVTGKKVRSSIVLSKQITAVEDVIEEDELPATAVLTERSAIAIKSTTTAFAGEKLAFSECKDELISVDCNSVAQLPSATPTVDDKSESAQTVNEKKYSLKLTEKQDSFKQSVSDVKQQVVMTEVSSKHASTVNAFDQNTDLKLDENGTALPSSKDDGSPSASMLLKTENAFDKVIEQVAITGRLAPTRLSTDALILKERASSDQHPTDRIVGQETVFAEPARNTVTDFSNQVAEKVVKSSIQHGVLRKGSSYEDNHSLGAKIIDQIVKSYRESVHHTPTKKSLISDQAKYDTINIRAENVESQKSSQGQSSKNASVLNLHAQADSFGPTMQVEETPFFDKSSKPQRLDLDVQSAQGSFDKKLKDQEDEQRTEVNDVDSSSAAATDIQFDKSGPNVNVPDFASRIQDHQPDDLVSRAQSLDNIGEALVPNKLKYETPTHAHYGADAVTVGVASKFSSRTVAQDTCLDNSIANQTQLVVQKSHGAGQESFSHKSRDILSMTVRRQQSHKSSVKSLAKDESEGSSHRNQKVQRVLQLDKLTQQSCKQTPEETDRDPNVSRFKYEASEAASVSQIGAVTSNIRKRETTEQMDVTAEIASCREYESREEQHVSALSELSTNRDRQGVEVSHSAENEEVQQDLTESQIAATEYGRSDSKHLVLLSGRSYQTGLRSDQALVSSRIGYTEGQSAEKVVDLSKDEERLDSGDVTARPEDCRESATVVEPEVVVIDEDKTREISGDERVVVKEDITQTIYADQTAPEVLTSLKEEEEELVKEDQSDIITHRGVQIVEPNDGDHHNSAANRLGSEEECDFSDEEKDQTPKLIVPHQAQTATSWHPKSKFGTQSTNLRLLRSLTSTKESRQICNKFATSETSSKMQGTQTNLNNIGMRSTFWQQIMQEAEQSQQDFRRSLYVLKQPSEQQQQPKQQSKGSGETYEEGDQIIFVDRRKEVFTAIEVVEESTIIIRLVQNEETVDVKELSINLKKLTQNFQADSLEEFCLDQLMPCFTIIEEVQVGLTLEVDHVMVDKLRFEQQHMLASLMVQREVLNNCLIMEDSLNALENDNDECGVAGEQTRRQMDITFEELTPIMQREETGNVTPDEFVLNTNETRNEFSVPTVANVSVNKEEQYETVMHQNDVSHKMKQETTLVAGQSATMHANCPIDETNSIDKDDNTGSETQLKLKSLLLEELEESNSFLILFNERRSISDQSCQVVVSADVKCNTLVFLVTPIEGTEVFELKVELDRGGGMQSEKTWDSMGQPAHKRVQPGSSDKDNVDMDRLNLQATTILKNLRIDMMSSKLRLPDDLMSQLTSYSDLTNEMNEDNLVYREEKEMNGHLFLVSVHHVQHVLVFNAVDIRREKSHQIKMRWTGTKLPTQAELRHHVAQLDTVKVGTPNTSQLEQSNTVEETEKLIFYRK